MSGTETKVNNMEEKVDISVEKVRTLGSAK